jgi:hypothetical protein
MKSFLSFIFTVAVAFGIPVWSFSQNAPTLQNLLGRWEVVSYSEQGVQVDKKAPALPQAVNVYNHVRKERLETWYGYYEEYEDRRSRALERWAIRDSTVEVTRIAKAIAMPYFVAFFADSTMTLYNKEATSNTIYFPEVWHFIFSPSTLSIDMYTLQPAEEPFFKSPYGKWEVQVLLLSENRMRLFIPQEAEVVELRKAEFSFP